MSEHDLNKFGFGLKRHFRSKPNWASNTFTILSCSNFLICYCFLCCCFFLFIRAPFKPASLNWAPWINIIQNKKQVLRSSPACPYFATISLQSLPSISNVRALTALLGLRGYQLSVESRNECTFILYCFSIVLYRTKRRSTTIQLNLPKLNGRILNLSQEEEGGDVISDYVPFSWV